MSVKILAIWQTSWKATELKGTLEERELADELCIKDTEKVSLLRGLGLARWASQVWGNS